MGQLVLSLPQADTPREQSHPMWEILIPEADNEREFFSEGHNRDWRNKVRGLTGGLTIHSAARGQWVDESDEGRLYKEVMIPVRIRCDEDTMNRIARITIEHYRQLAVCFYMVSAECQFRYA